MTDRPCQINIRPLLEDCDPSLTVDKFCLKHQATAHFCGTVQETGIFSWGQRIGELVLGKFHSYIWF